MILDMWATSYKTIIYFPFYGIIIFRVPQRSAIILFSVILQYSTRNMLIWGKNDLLIHEHRNNHTCSSWNPFFSTPVLLCCQHYTGLRLGSTVSQNDWSTPVRGSFARMRPSNINSSQPVLTLSSFGRLCNVQLAGRQLVIMHLVTNNDTRHFTRTD